MEEKRALREVLTRNKILLRRGKEVLSFYIRPDPLSEGKGSLYRRRSQFVERRGLLGPWKAFALKGWRIHWHRDSAPSPIKMFFEQASF